MGALKKGAEIVVLDIGTGRPVRKWLSKQEATIVSDWIHGKIGVDMVETGLTFVVQGLGTWVRAGVLSVCLAGTTGLAERLPNATGLPHAAHGVKSAYGFLLGVADWPVKGIDEALQKGQANPHTYVSIPASVGRIFSGLGRLIIEGQQGFMTYVHQSLSSEHKVGDRTETITGTTPAQYEVK